MRPNNVNVAHVATALITPSTEQPRVTTSLVLARSRRLSEEIAAVIEAFGERPLTLREVMAVLRGRAYTLLILLLALPFCSPIPLPGLSLPFGVVIALVGLRLAANMEPSLPDKVLNTRLPAGFFKRLLSAAQRLVGFLERFLKPRMSGLLEARVLRHGYGMIIAVCGLFLLLPLPIPFSNGFPALTVVLLSGAMLERDGYCLVAGLVAFAATLCFYGALAWGGFEGVDAIKDWITLLVSDR